MRETNGLMLNWVDGCIFWSVSERVETKDSNGTLRKSSRHEGSDGCSGESAPNRSRNA